MFCVLPAVRARVLVCVCTLVFVRVGPRVCVERATNLLPASPLVIYLYPRLRVWVLARVARACWALAALL